jgi:hypothetical protein
MSKKSDRAKYGPSWAEVTLGAALSLGLGIVLGALLLIVRPVVVAKEMPKEADRDRKAVYYIEGSRDPGKARQAAAKRQSFVAGQSISVTEDEINSLITPNPAAGAPGAKPKAPEKPKDPKAKDGKDAAPAGDSGDALAVGSPNFRINSGLMQIGVPVTVNALGLDQKIIVQARGGFTKDGNVFVYDPQELYFGSCPVQRLPFLSGYVRSKFLAGQPIPEDIKTAWTKLSNVAIDGNTLKLTMP